MGLFLVIFMIENGPEINWDSPVGHEAVIIIGFHFSIDYSNCLNSECSLFGHAHPVPSNERWETWPVSNLKVYVVWQICFTSLKRAKRPRLSISARLKLRTIRMAVWAAETGLRLVSKWCEFVGLIDSPYSRRSQSQNAKFFSVLLFCERDFGHCLCFSSRYLFSDKKQISLKVLKLTLKAREELFARTNPKR